MTVHKTYSCNFCGGSKELLGVYWKTDVSLEHRQVRQTNNHICRKCLKALKEMHLRDYVSREEIAKDVPGD